MMLSNLLTRFKEDERGIATIESLLWMPLFFYLFIAITDVSFIFYGKAQALRVVQDGNRAYSVNILKSNEETSDYIEGRLRLFAPGATATTTVSNGVIITRATIDSSDLMAVGSIPNFVGLDINIVEQHFREF
jgi:Flp pilus assembly protein TadG